MRVLLALAICAGMQAATTTITQSRIAAGDGKHLATGTITIAATAAFTAADGVRVETTELSVAVTNGAFTVALEPNDSGSPTGTQYTATWQLTGAKLRRDLWMVPTTANVLTVRDVVVSTVTLPGTIIQWQQLSQNGATVGQAPIWNGTNWTPGYVAGTGGAWGSIIGSLSAQTDLAAALAAKANASSLAAVATSGSASDLGTGTLPASRLSMWGNGSRPVAAGALGAAGNCAQWTAAGLSDAGAPCGTGGGAVSSVFGRTGAVAAGTGDYTAAQVTNAVDATGSYSNPPWIAALAYTKITGVPSFEPAIAAGTASQYWRGDKSWQALTTANVTESGNLYFTAARAQSALSGMYEVPLSFSAPLSRAANTISLPLWGTGTRPVAAAALGVAGNCVNWAATGLGDAGLPCGSGGGSHALLSATHTDTTAASAIRGDGLFAVGATPTWQRVAHPTISGGYWKWNGTDVVASTLAASGTGACTNGVVTGVNADAVPTCTTADSTTTHALFMTGSGPAPRAIAVGDIPILNQSTTGNAATATALAATPTLCSAGNYPLGVDASGNAVSCTPVAGSTSGPYSVASKPAVSANTAVMIIDGPDCNRSIGTTYQLCMYDGSAWHSVGRDSASAPTFSPAAGTYGSTQTVTVTAPSGGFSCLTADGTTTPVATQTTCTTGTQVASGGTISVSASETLLAVASGTGLLASYPATSAAYTISAGSGMIASDSFTRANGDIGANWTYNYGTTGNLVIASNALSSTATGDITAHYSALPLSSWPADQYAQATASSVTSDYAGIGVRWDATANNGYACNWSSAAMYIWKKSWGITHFLQTAPGHPVNGDVIKIAVTGSTTPVVTCSVNGTVVATLTDTDGDPITAGFPAVAGYSGTAQTAKITNWTAGH